MTRDEWLRCAEPLPLLQFLAGRASDRKLRLFACACCRRVGDGMTDARSRAAVEVAEQFADGFAGGARLAESYEAAQRAERGFGGPAHAATQAANAAHVFYPGTPSAVSARAAAENAANYASAAAADRRARDPDTWERARADERKAQAALLREIVNPFRGPAGDLPGSPWAGGAVRELAEAIYRERRFEDLPVLADALEEAGCTDAEILNHLRGPGPHVPGCWALDLLVDRG